MTIRIGVLAPESSWHFQDLERASKLAQHDIELQSIDFANLAASVGTHREERFCDHSTNLNSLDALIVRAMPSGSLQQIIFRMDVLHRLAASGVRIFNEPRSMEIAIDKYLSLSLMAAAGIPVPKFSVCQTVEQGIEAFYRLGGDVVLKPIFGSMGKNLHRIVDPEDPEPILEQFIERGEVLYMQEYVNHGGTDVRILVVGDETFSMCRTNPNGGWLTNIAKGGIAQPFEPLPEEIQLAKAAAKANHCKIAGVDLIRRGSVNLAVLEVNASPGWEALQKVCERDVARSVLKLIATTIGGQSKDK